MMYKIVFSAYPRGGGGQAIATPLPPLDAVWCCLHVIIHVTDFFLWAMSNTLSCLFPGILTYPRGGSQRHQTREHTTGWIWSVVKMHNVQCSVWIADFIPGITWPRINIYVMKVCGAVVPLVCVVQWYRWCVWCSGTAGVCGVVVPLVCVVQWYCNCVVDYMNIYNLNSIRLLETIGRC